MSKRIEELERNIEFAEREKVIFKKDEYIRLWELKAKLEERKLSEKEFLDKLNEIDNYIQQVKNDVISTEEPFSKIYSKEAITPMTDGALIVLSQVDNKIEELKKEVLGE